MEEYLKVFLSIFIFIQLMTVKYIPKMRGKIPVGLGIFPARKHSLLDGEIGSE